MSQPAGEGEEQGERERERSRGRRRERETDSLRKRVHQRIGEGKKNTVFKPVLMKDGDRRGNIYVKANGEEGGGGGLFAEQPSLCREAG